MNVEINIVSYNEAGDFVEAGASFTHDECEQGDEAEVWIKGQEWEHETLGYHEHHMERTDC